MPAYNKTHQVAPRTWVLLTPTAAVAAARIQCQGPYELHICANQSLSVPPDDTEGSWLLRPADGVDGSVTIKNLFLGRVGVGVTAYLWAYSESQSSVSVTHE